VPQGHVFQCFGLPPRGLWELCGNK
jgi:hypothetical protein